jgi:hypothetical protein
LYSTSIRYSSKMAENEISSTNLTTVILFFCLKHLSEAKMKQLDRLLYKLSNVGKLIRDGVIELDDINFVRHIASSTLKDEQVIAYLEWLKEALPNHSSFVDAIYLFERIYGKRDGHYSRIKMYLGK